MEGLAPRLQEVPPLPVRRFTVEEYHRLIALGVLEEETRVELVEGWIVPQEKRTPLNAVGVTLAAKAIDRLLPPGWHWRVRGSITTKDSEPTPAVAVVRGTPRLYRQRHPGPADVALVIDVADASLEAARLVMTRVYARAAIPAYWIVNLVDQRIEVFTNPINGRREAQYLSRLDVRAPESAPLVLDAQNVGAIAAAELLP